MKKVLLTSAALGLALAFTATAASAMTFTMGGKVNLTGIYLNNGQDSTNGFMAGIIDDGNVENVDGYHYSVYTYPKLVINDQTSVQGELRFIDREPYGADPGSDRDTMKVFKLWANWNSNFGTISFGRMPAGTWGSKFLNSTGAADRIKWANSYGAFSVVALMEKEVEYDAFDEDTDQEDREQYLVGVGFGNDMGRTDLALWHTRQGEDASQEYDNTELWFNGSYSFGAIGLETEAKYAMGEDSSGDDISSFAAMVNASTKIDTFTAGLLFFYGQGDSDSGGDNEGYTTKGGFGNDYNPFLIATGDYFGLLNGDKGGYFQSTSRSGNGDNPGAIALALYGVFPINDQLTANAAIGHVWADEEAALHSDISSNRVGWEVDFGISYKLASNLVYSASVGFLNTGDMVQEYAEAIDSSYDANNILALVHSLTMTW